MVGKLAPYVGVGLVQTALVLVLARLLFGVPLSGGWGALSIGVALFIVGSLSLGFLFSLSLIHIPEPTRLLIISYVVFCFK